MRLTDITPFRQLARGYASILGIKTSLNSIEQSVTGAIENFGQKQLNSVDLIGEKLSSVDESLRLLTSIIDRATPPPPDNDISIHEIAGYRMLLDRTSLVDRLVIETGEWEGEQIKYLKQLAARFRNRDNPIFLDIGAYWGYYSLILCGTGIFNKIYAFDADAYNFSQLQANIFLNKLDHMITAYHAAVSDTSGILTVQNSRMHDDGNRGATRILAPHEISDDSASRNVSATAIDQVIQIKNGHIVIKMDVEAHEDRALIGMKNLILNNKIILQIEIYKEQASRVIPVLESLGLRQICDIYPDFFYTNLSREEIGC